MSRPHRIAHHSSVEMRIVLAHEGAPKDISTEVRAEVGDWAGWEIIWGGKNCYVWFPGTNDRPFWSSQHENLCLPGKVFKHSGTPISKGQKKPPKEWSDVHRFANQKCGLVINPSVELGPHTNAWFSSIFLSIFYPTAFRCPLFYSVLYFHVIYFSLLYINVYMFSTLSSTSAISSFYIVCFLCFMQSIVFRFLFRWRHLCYLFL